MIAKNIHQKLIGLANHLQPLALLFLRLGLAYGFFHPAMMKWQHINDIADWFKSIGIVAPRLNAYLVATCEALGVLLLPLGLFTRYISIPLMVSMVVAIKTVHWANGFDASDNGFEIPLYYLLMLFTLLSFGAGKWSVDYLFFFKRKCKTKLSSL